MSQSFVSSSRRFARRFGRAQALTAVLLAGVLAASPAQAQNYTWNGGSAVDSNWSTIFNWGGLNFPNSSHNNVLTFSGTTRQTNNQNLGQNWAVGSMLMTTTGWNLSGFSFSFIGGGLTNKIESTGTSNTIANALRFDANGAQRDNGIGVFGTGSTLWLTGALSGNGLVVKRGSGTLRVLGNNTVSSGYRIEGGTVITSAQLLQSSAQINSGTTLDFLNGLDGTYNSNLWGSGTFRKSGVGTVTLNGGGTFNGTTRIAEGGLRGRVGSILGNVIFDGPGSGRVLHFDQATNASYFGNITGPANNIIRKSGVGRLWMFGTHDSGLNYDVQQGNLAIKQPNLGPKVTLGSAGTLEVYSDTPNQFQYNGQFIGAGTVQFFGGATMELLSNQTQHTGRIELVDGNMIANNNLLNNWYGIWANSTLTTRTNGDAAFGAIIDGTGTVRKQGTGTLDFRAYQEYFSGNFMLDEGKALIGNNLRGALGLAAGTEATVQNLASAGITSIGGPITGSGKLNIQSETWLGILAHNTANAHTGPLNILSGYFSAPVSGLSPDITINAGATLEIAGQGGVYTKSLKGGPANLWIASTGTSPVEFSKVDAFAPIVNLTVRSGILESNTRQWNKDVMVLNGGTFRLNQPFNDSWKGQLFGGGTFEKSGAGQLKMNDQAFEGSIKVSGGTMLLDNVSVDAFYGVTTGTQGRIQLRNGSLSAWWPIENNGTLLGTGTVAGSVLNGVSGRILIGANDRMDFSGSLNSAGAITLGGGSLSLNGSLLNETGGLISGRGTLEADSIYNQGAMAFSGDTDLVGDVVNMGGSSIKTTGGSTLTFHDDVIHNGTEIFTGAGSRSVFLGSVSGAGAYTGTGTVEMLGDLRPGNSPALSVFHGDLILGSGTTTLIELGGTVKGSEYDSIQVGGKAYLAGNLDIVLYEGFVPKQGDRFQILSGTMVGTFDNVFLPNLGKGMSWNTSSLYIDGNVEAVPEPASMAALALGALAVARRRRK